VHLVCGRDKTHLMTEIETNLLGEELNKKELLNLLIIEKGEAAKIMIGYNYFFLIILFKK